MVKPFTHAHLVAIVTLQFLDRLVHPRITSSKFGCDSLTMIGITPHGPPIRRLRRSDWASLAADRHAVHIDGITTHSRVSIGDVIRDYLGAFAGVVAGPLGLGAGRSVGGCSCPFAWGGDCGADTLLLVRCLDLVMILD